MTFFSELDYYLEKESELDRLYAGSWEEEEYYLDRMSEFLAKHGIDLYDDYGFSLGHEFWLLDPGIRRCSDYIMIALAAARHIGQFEPMVKALDIRKSFIECHDDDQLIFGLEEEE